MELMRRRSFPLVGATLAVVPLLAWLTVMKPGLIGAAVIAIPVLYTLVWTLSRPLEQAVVCYIVVYVLADSLKRLVVVFVPDAPQAQYVPFAFKYLLLVSIGLRGLHQRTTNRQLDTADKAMIAFLGFSVIGIVAAGCSWKAKVAMMPLSLGPYLAFFAFREAFRERVWVERTLGLVIAAAGCAAAYGLFQSWYGPSWIDTEWARVSHEFSIQAENVWRAMAGLQMMRPYSFFADHFSYGYFLVGALIALVVVRRPVSAWGRAAVASVFLVALGSALTRTAWVSLFLIVACALSFRYLTQVRGLVWGGMLASYMLLTGALTPLYETVFPAQSFASASAANAFSVGTLAERREGLSAFGTALARQPIIGDAAEATGAFQITAKLSGDLESLKSIERFDDAHNFLVDKTVKAGGLGLLAFLWFLVAVVRGSGRTREARWALAAVCGLFLAGVAGSETILAGLFIPWCALALGAGSETSESCSSTGASRAPGRVGGVNRVGKSA